MKKTCLLAVCLIFLLGCSRPSPFSTIVTATNLTPVDILVPTQTPVATGEPPTSNTTPPVSALEPTEAMGDEVAYLPVVNAYLHFEASGHRAFDINVLHEKFLTHFDVESALEKDDDEVNWNWEFIIGVYLRKTHFLFDLFDFNSDGVFELVISAYHYESKVSQLLTVYTLYEGAPRIAFEKSHRNSTAFICSDGTIHESSKHDVFFYRLMPLSGAFVFEDGLAWELRGDEDGNPYEHFFFYPDYASFANKTPVEYGRFPEGEACGRKSDFFRRWHGINIQIISENSPFNKFRNE